jgi:PAS domain S-box-containing protein
MITPKAKILCVDDDPDLLNINVTILRSAGYEVIEASTGNECIAAAKKEHPDLILLDVVLPDINGIDVCKRIKADPELSDTYILLLSGIETSSEVQANGLEAGADGYVARPVSGKELIARVQAMIRLKQAETAIRRNEDRLRFLLRATPAVIYTCKASYPYGATFVSENVETQMGYKPEEFTENADFWAANIHPEDISRVFKGLPRLFDQGHYAHEYRFLYKDGIYRWMLDQMNLIRNDNGTPVEIIGYWHDITDRKQAEEELRSSEERFRLIFDNASDGILLADLENRRLHMANKMICQMLGYSLEEIIKLEVMDIHPEEDLPYVIEQFEKQARHEIILSKDIPMKRKDGSIFYADVNSFIVPLKGKKYLAGIFRDTTERKQSEDALKESRNKLEEAMYLAQAANSTKSEFLANMSHELTTPLNSIIGFSQVLQDGLYGDLNEKQKEYLSDILNSGMSLLGLITDMLDLSKVESGKAELKASRFFLKDVLKTMSLLFKNRAMEHSIILSLDIDPDADVEIEADAGMMKQILFNLLDNAVKFTPDGGNIRVAARKMYKEAVTAKSVSDKAILAKEIALSSARNDNVTDFIEITVEDTGIGIEPEKMKHLFYAFTQLESPYTKRHKGTGLGLLLTKRLIELHGGRIWIESEFGKGSKFTFLIPLKQKG